MNDHRSHMREAHKPVLPTHEPSNEDAKPEAKAGYLILRLRIGDGVVIADNIEVRLSSRRGHEIQVAFRAPKHVPIRRVR